MNVSCSGFGVGRGQSFQPQMLLRVPAARPTEHCPICRIRGCRSWSQGSNRGPLGGLAIGAQAVLQRDGLVGVSLIGISETGMNERQAN